MTREEAIAILKNEKECVNRANKNDYCNRDCYNCELVKTDTEILTALDMAISALKDIEKIQIIVDTYFTRGSKSGYECMGEIDRILEPYQKGGEE